MGKQLDKGQAPGVLRPGDPEKVDLSKFKDEEREELRQTWERLASGDVFTWDESSTQYGAAFLGNASLPKCFNCGKVAIWLYDRMVWPVRGEGPSPSEDMPEPVKLDFLEASSIVQASPRGAAALLRLSLQKLCIHLGGKGENLNEDIRLLVRDGLDPRVQQALDVVRVVGNNAVHPGEINLTDDRAIALQLFELVNLIVDIMITQREHVRRMYEGLPQGALRAIERRDAPPKGGTE